MSKVTPTIISSLPLDAIFCFGSNLSGAHGAGAARDAVKWGAVRGQPFGLQGRTFAIPTKGKMPSLPNLPLDKIKPYIDAFWVEVAKKPHRTFMITAIGTGLAGNRAEHMAPLFWHSYTRKTDNFTLPQSFWDVINKLS